MMRYLVAFLIFSELLLSGSAIACSVSENSGCASEYVFVTSIPYLSGKPDSSKSFTSSQMRFDSSGRLIELIEFNKSGDVKDKENNFYDLKGRIVKKVKISSELLYDYDEKGNLMMETEKSLTRPYPVITNKSWSYDPNNNIIEEKIIDSAGIVIWWVGYMYDSGRFKKITGFHPDMNVFWTEDFQYNESGRKTGIDYVDNSGGTYKKERWSYDDNGDTVAYEELNSYAITTSKKVYTYYEKGKLNKCQSFDITGKIVSSKSYDNYGNLTDDIVFNTDGSIFKQKKMMYGSKNEKIKEVIIFQNEITEERSFNYFPEKK